MKPLFIYSTPHCTEVFREATVKEKKKRKALDSKGSSKVYLLQIGKDHQKNLKSIKITKE